MDFFVIFLKKNVFCLVMVQMIIYVSQFDFQLVMNKRCVYSNNGMWAMYDVFVYLQMCELMCVY